MVNSNNQKMKRKTEEKTLQRIDTESALQEEKKSSKTTLLVTAT